jgi:hypothetical protein
MRRTILIVAFIIAIAGNIVRSEADCAANIKFNDYLCAKWDSFPDTAYLPVRIFFKQLVFNCDGKYYSGDTTCNAKLVDTTEKYWMSLKPEICRIFLTYSLFDTGSTTKRLDSSDFNLWGVYHTNIQKSELSELANESLLVRVELISIDTPALSINTTVLHPVSGISASSIKTVAVEAKRMNCSSGIEPIPVRIDIRGRICKNTKVIPNGIYLFPKQ